MEWPYIVLIAAGALLITIFIALLVFCIIRIRRKKRKKQAEDGGSQGGSLPNGFVSNSAQSTLPLDEEQRAKRFQNAINHSQASLKEAPPVKYPTLQATNTANHDNQGQPIYDIPSNNRPVHPTETSSSGRTTEPASGNSQLSPAEQFMQIVQHENRPGELPQGHANVNTRNNVHTLPSTQGRSERQIDAESLAKTRTLPQHASSSPQQPQARLPVAFNRATLPRKQQAPLTGASELGTPGLMSMPSSEIVGLSSIHYEHSPPSTLRRKNSLKRLRKRGEEVFAQYRSGAARPHSASAEELSDLGVSQDLMPPPRLPPGIMRRHLSMMNQAYESDGNLVETARTAYETPATQ